MITSIFSDQIMKYIGYIEISVGVGLGLGPTLGSIVYNKLDYEGTMYMFGCLNFVTMLICILLIPSELNKTASDEEIAEYEAEIEERRLAENGGVELLPKHKIGWGTLLCNRHSLFAMIICFFGTFNIVFF